MTSELRPAVEVWIDAVNANIRADDSDLASQQAAAAVIEAYGDEREAKGRAEQAAELAKFKALAETLAGALGEIAQPDYGYTDILERGCPPEKHTEYFCSMVTWRQRTAREALREYKEARDAS